MFDYVDNLTIKIIFLKKIVFTLNLRSKEVTTIQ